MNNFYIDNKEQFLAKITSVLSDYYNYIVQMQDKPAFKNQNVFRLAYAQLLLSGKYECTTDIADLAKQIIDPKNTDYDSMTYRQLFEHLVVRPQGSGWQENRRNKHIPMNIKPGYLYFDDEETMQAIEYLENFKYDEDLDGYEVRGILNLQTGSDDPYSLTFGYTPLKVNHNGKQEVITNGTGVAENVLRQYELLRYGTIMTDFNDPRAIAESLSYLRFQTGFINLVFKCYYKDVVEYGEHYCNDDSTLLNRKLKLQDLREMVKYLK